MSALAKGVNSTITELQFRALANSIPNLAWMADPEGWLFWYNDRWYEYTGTTPEEMMGWGWQAVHHPDVLPEMLKRWTAALKTGETFEMTFPLRRGSDGSFRVFMTRAEPLREDGRIIAWLGTNTDITEQERTRERLQLVINELNHRVKNMLATVQSIAHSSFGSIDSASYSVFEQRLMSLAKVHDLLTRQQWSAAALEELIEAQIATFGRDRFILAGPDVQIDPRIASPLAMVFHELATNALKYGSLSSEAGLVHLDWQCDSQAGRRWLLIDWREEGGPPVVEPASRGFGLKLISRAVSSERGSVAKYEFQREGFRCHMKIVLQEGTTWQPA